MGLILRNNAIIKNLVIGGTGGGGESGGGGGGGFSIPISTTNLQMYWDASQYTSGTTMTDQTGNGNNGTINGSPTFTSAGDASYFTFSNLGGSTLTGNDTITVQSSNNFSFATSAEITMTAWVKSVPTTTNARFLHGLGELNGTHTNTSSPWDDNNTARIYTLINQSGLSGGGAPYNNKLDARFFSPNQKKQTNLLATGAELDNGQWNSVTVTISTSQMKLYRNGTLVDTVTHTQYSNGVTGSDLGEYVFGKIPSSLASHMWSGDWAVSAIYNAELSATDVLNNYNALATRYP